MKFGIKSLTVGLFKTTSKDPLRTSLRPGYDEQILIITRLEAEDEVLRFGKALATPFIAGETIETMFPAVDMAVYDAPGRSPGVPICVLPGGNDDIAVGIGFA
jgi:L-alanine-DL-glutamate epimerase-like enolase superfamily enzyme